MAAFWYDVHIKCTADDQNKVFKCISHCKLKYQVRLQRQSVKMIFQVSRDFCDAQTLLRKWVMGHFFSLIPCLPVFFVFTEKHSWHFNIGKSALGGNKEQKVRWDILPCPKLRWYFLILTCVVGGGQGPPRARLVEEGGVGKGVLKSLSLTQVFWYPVWDETAPARHRLNST